MSNYSRLNIGDLNEGGCANYVSHDRFKTYDPLVQAENRRRDLDLRIGCRFAEGSSNAEHLL